MTVHPLVARPSGPRRGIALVVVLLALALLGVLAAGVTFASALRIRGDRRLDRAPVALAAAESIAVVTMLDWHGTTAARAAAGLALDSSERRGSRTVRSRLSPLRRGRFALAVSVDDGAAGGARAGVWLAIRRDPIPMPHLAALGTNSVPVLSAAAAVRGEDAPSSDAPACMPSDDVAALAPMPAMLDDAWIATLAAHAEVPLPRAASPTTLSPAPSAVDGHCDVDSFAAWGEPDAGRVAACRAYFPVVVVDGSLELAGGRGQGVLVVGGDLVMRGDARFVGLVVVRGRASLADDARITGALVVRDVDRGGVSLADHAIVQRSECAVAAAVAAAGAPHPDGVHAWAPQY